MCGILGVALRQPAERPEILEMQRDSMAHRGPDDAGVWWSDDRRIGLAHRRLSILDLSAAGHQPMEGPAGLRITFNGEIYNFPDVRRTLEDRGYRFRSGTDTEVLLSAYHAWGVDCVSRLRGMFAFGIWDPSARRLFLARDRAGEKPLFIFQDAGRFAFASEVKAIIADPAVPRRLDPEGLDFFLAYGYVAHDRSLLRGIRKLPQGHALLYDVDSEKLEIWRYWDLPSRAPARRADPSELTDELEELLEDSVRRQLVADVPVGILLSGGLDSSLVTAMAARASRLPLKTFTVTFPGHGRYDEAPHAKLVAKHFGTEHTELVAEAATVDLLPRLARQYDDPLGDSSMVPTFLVSELIRQHATVALGGDGGDELFAGYHVYSRFLRQQRARRYIPRSLRAMAGSLAAHRLPVGFKGRGYIMAFSADLPDSIGQHGVLFDATLRQRLLAPTRGYLSGTGQPEHFRTDVCAEGTTDLQKMTRADFKSYLVDDILAKVDRASMLASLEVRAPWLDFPIIEFAFGRVPDSMRATTGDKKILPKMLARRLLPPSLDINRKQGFSIPLSDWAGGAWGAFFRDVLTEADRDLFDRKTLLHLLAMQNGNGMTMHRLYALTMFELWRREYRIASL